MVFHSRTRKVLRSSAANIQIVDQDDLIGLFTSFEFKSDTLILVDAIKTVTKIENFLNLYSHDKVGKTH